MRTACGDDAVPPATNLSAHTATAFCSCVLRLASIDFSRFLKRSSTVPAALVKSVEDEPSRNTAPASDTVRRRLGRALRPDAQGRTCCSCAPCVPRGRYFVDWLEGQGDRNPFCSNGIDVVGPVGLESTSPSRFLSTAHSL